MEIEKAVYQNKTTSKRHIHLMGEAMRVKKR
jgi:hypothetical protein